MRRKATKDLTFSEVLQTLRDTGLSHQKIADQIGTPRPHISVILNPRIEAAILALVRKIRRRSNTHE